MYITNTFVAAFVKGKIQVQNTAPSLKSLKHTRNYVNRNVFFLNASYDIVKYAWLNALCIATDLL